MYTYPTLSIPKLHTEYADWMDELTFYKEEIKIFERHLEKLTKHNYNTEMMAGVEHFQNAFICQKEVIDLLKHNLHISERQLSAFVKEVCGMGLSSIKMDNHSELRTEMQTFRKLFSELKVSFRQFESSCRLNAIVDWQKHKGFETFYSIK